MAETGAAAPDMGEEMAEDPREAITMVGQDKATLQEKTTEARSSLLNKVDMHTKFHKSLLWMLVVLASCHPNVYRSTNRVYKKQSKQYARQFRQYPLHDSVSTSPAFVGTTNFSLRKPNFVVIHHTAQGGCDTTLRTFTLPRTQVSALSLIHSDTADE